MLIKMNLKCSENVPFDTIGKEVSNAAICICILINTFLTFHVQGKKWTGRLTVLTHWHNKK